MNGQGFVFAGIAVAEAVSRHDDDRVRSHGIDVCKDFFLRTFAQRHNGYD